MISRLATIKIKEFQALFPAVLILGARQCGKTTLARHFLAGDYFDLEKPSDRQVFSTDLEIALQHFSGPLILDEAQTMPDLFPVLRALIDEKRRENGRFILLGSVNPSLIRQISESLAGRVGTIELTPFLFAELISSKFDLKTVWLRGGFPDAVQQTEDEKRILWQENYIRTVIERDIPLQGHRLSPIQIRRLVTMLANVHGGLLNASEIGRSLGINYHTVQEYLDTLEGHFLVRRLYPYSPNVKKRLVKAPKFYIRDSGLLHYLFGIKDERDLIVSPKRGASWEGFLVEQAITRVQLHEPGSQFFFYRTHAGMEIDLIVISGGRCVGYEFKCGFSVDRADWANLKSGLDEGIIQEGTVVYLGKKSFPIADGLSAVGAREFLAR